MDAETFVKIYGEEHRKVIESALEFLETLKKIPGIDEFNEVEYITEVMSRVVKK